jgi:hypothetical protein
MKKKTGGGKHPTIRVYTHYDYTYDPAMEEVLAFFEKAGLTPKEAEERSGVSQSTFRNWGMVGSSGKLRKKKTRRPQSFTLEAAGRSMGYGRVWKKLKDI